MANKPTVFVVDDDPGIPPVLPPTARQSVLQCRLGVFAWIRERFIPTSGGLTARPGFGMLGVSWSGGCSAFRQSFSIEESLSC